MLAEHARFYLSSIRQSDVHRCGRAHESRDSPSHCLTAVLRRNTGRSDTLSIHPVALTLSVEEYRRTGSRRSEIRQGGGAGIMEDTAEQRELCPVVGTSEAGLQEVTGVGGPESDAMAGNERVESGSIWTSMAGHRQVWHSIPATRHGESASKERSPGGVGAAWPGSTCECPVDASVSVMHRVPVP